MASGVDELLDMLFQMIDEAKGVLMSPDKCTIERDKALDLLDEIRAQFPMELAEAKKLFREGFHVEVSFQSGLKLAAAACVRHNSVLLYFATVLSR